MILFMYILPILRCLTTVNLQTVTEIQYDGQIL